MDAVEFWSICSLNGLPLTDEQMGLFGRYAEDLLHWNEKINLISRRDIDQIWSRHILHSITPILMDVIPRSGRLLDIGTGGGLPGIPLKIAEPRYDATLVDSIAKKANTTSMLASHVTTKGLRVIRARVEALADEKAHRTHYEVVVSRATAALVDLMTWSRPLVTPGATLVALKGGTLIDELEHAEGKHPDCSIEIRNVEVRGTGIFQEQEKKVVIVRFPD